MAINLNNPMEISEIMDGLFLGSIESIFNLDGLNYRSIKHVISALSDNPFNCEFQFNHYFIPMDDTEEQNLLFILNRTYDLIFNCLNKNENILVHCQSGISRSAAIVIGFLMRQYSYCYFDAYHLVLAKRPIIKPNVNFQKQLAIYELINHQITMSNIWFKRFLFAHFVKNNLFQIQYHRNLFRNELKNEEIQFSSVRFRCKLCRNILFGENDVIRYDQNVCHIFPTKWILNNDYFHNSGNLYCEKCSAKIGFVNWDKKKIQYEKITFNIRNIDSSTELNNIELPMIFSINIRRIDKIQIKSN